MGNGDGSHLISPWARRRAPEGLPAERPAGTQPAPGPAESTGIGPTVNKPPRRFPRLGAHGLDVGYRAVVWRKPHRATRGERVLYKAYVWQQRLTAPGRVASAWTAQALEPLPAPLAGLAGTRRFGPSARSWPLPVPPMSGPTGASTR